jgi:hypothetical protein
MKLLLLFITCLFALNGFAQTNETITEEKSSVWIKIVEDPVAASKPLIVKKQTTTVKKKTTAPKPVTPKQVGKEEFEKTNEQVNRFKKGKKAN